MIPDSEAFLLDQIRDMALAAAMADAQRVNAALRGFTEASEDASRRYTRAMLDLDDLVQDLADFILYGAEA